MLGIAAVSLALLSLSPSPEEDADRIDQQIEQVRFAERLGFGDVWLT